MKRPAFQFYPADWRKDAALQSCSIAAQGLWINALCIAHECDPYGHLTVNGKPMTGAQVARLVGLSPKDCDKLLSELEEAGVLARAADGAIFSRRMVRDEDLRNRRANGGQAGAEHGAKGAEHGAKGGRPPKARGVSKPPSEPPPSSSSSTSVNSVPSGTDGEPSASMTKAELWAAGRSLLLAQGMPDAQCRSFMGKLVSDHGENLVGAAVRAAVVAQPQEVREYLVATCRGMSKVIPETTKAMAEPVPKWATKAGFADRFEANNAGCFEKTAHLFSNGKRTEVVA